MYPKKQISILQRFLKDRMTLKTGVMIKKIFYFSETRIIYILKYNKIAKISIIYSLWTLETYLIKSYMLQAYNGSAHFLFEQL